jgi:hypothetical protein
MADMEVRDARVKVGEYEKDGKTKARYQTIGVGFVSAHQSNIYLQIDTLPRDLQSWDGRIYLNARGSKNNDQVGEVTDEPINLNDIPF